MSQQPCLPFSRRRKRDGDESLVAAPIVTVDDVQDMDADAFLRRVVTQAETLPETPTATGTPASHNKRSRPRQEEPEVIIGSAACVEFLVSHRSVQLHPAPTAACSRSWVYDTVLPSFERLRQYIDAYHALGVGSKGHGHRVPVPTMKDRSGWAQFCCGNVVSRNDDDTEAATPPWKENLPEDTGYYTPTVSLLLQLDQVMVRRVLVHLVEEVVSLHHPYNSNCTSPLFQWIYGLLARLEQPVHREDAVVLYKLLQHLTYVRHEHHATLSVAVRSELNLLVAIVGIYFGQGAGYEQLMVPPGSRS